MFSLVLMVACGSSGPEEATVFEDLGLVAPEDPGAEAEAQLAAEREAQEAAAVCMREQGYPYEPWSEIELVAAIPVAAAEPGSRGFAEERGYGVLFGFPQSLETHPSAKKNPNQPYVDGLTNDEKFVYYETLLGVAGGDGLMRPGVDEELYLSGGCLGRELEGIAEEMNLYGELVGAYETLEVTVNSDQRLLDYDREWSACMAEQGLTYASSPAAMADFEGRSSELWATVVFPADAYSADELVAMSEAERTALYTAEPEFDEQEWESWLEEERQVATADFDCQGDQPREDLFIEVLAEHQDAFVAANSTVIDQLEDES
ncbi:MAG: hypothetical protein ACK5RL_09335 [Acidimicrobiales bacterium]